MVAFECWLAYQRSSSLSRSLPRTRASVRSTTAISSLMSVPVYMALTPCPALKFLSGTAARDRQDSSVFLNLAPARLPWCVPGFTTICPNARSGHVGGPGGFSGAKLLFTSGAKAPPLFQARFGAPEAAPFQISFDSHDASFSRVFQIRSAARSFALRDRGLRSISSWLAVTGFFVSNL